MSDYLSELTKEVPKELYDKYSREIDDLVLESRTKIKGNVHAFTPKKNSLLIPLIINISAVVIIFTGLLLIDFFFNLQEQNIISNYTVLNTVEGRILLEYKQQTEEKLRQINDEIGKIEQRLLSVTEEKNNLMAGIDTIILEKQKELESQMEQEIEEERLKLQEQGLSAEAIEQQLRVLEQEKQSEIDLFRAELREKLEEEYEIKQSDYLALLNDYETTLKQIQTQRIYLETELENSNVELTNLAEHINIQTSQAESPAESTVLNSINEYLQEEDLVIEQISVMYRKIEGNIENMQFEKAEENLNNLSSFLNEESIALLPAIQKRRELEEFIIGSLRKLLEFETFQEPENNMPELTETVINTTAAADIQTNTEDSKLIELIEQLELIESEFNRFFTDNPGILSYTSEEEFIALVEVKLRVKEILSTDPIASEYPGLAGQLEDYYSALGNEKVTTGRLYALFDVLDLIENLENKNSSIRNNWDDFNNVDVKNSFLQIIQKLQSVLE